MTSPAAASTPPRRVTLVFRRQSDRDQEIRATSRRKRAVLLEAIAQHPDAGEGLRRQAEFYRRRLEAGMEMLDDAD